MIDRKSMIRDAVIAVRKKKALAGKEDAKKMKNAPAPTTAKRKGRRRAEKAPLSKHEEIQLMIAEYQEGTSLVFIAMRFKTTRFMVTKYLRDSGCKIREPITRKGESK